MRIRAQFSDTDTVRDEFGIVTNIVKSVDEPFDVEVDGNLQETIQRLVNISYELGEMGGYYSSSSPNLRLDVIIEE